MKKRFWIFLMILAMVSCNSYKSYEKDTNLCKLNDNVTNKEMVFDKTKYSLEKDTIINNDTLISRYYKYEEGDITNKQTLVNGFGIRFQENLRE